MRIILPALILLMSIRPSSYCQQTDKEKVASIQSSMIWTSENPAGKQVYIAFRKDFIISKVSSPALLKLFADSRYLLWINGRYVMRGPCRFNPKRPEYDLMDIQPFIKTGKNVVVVLVHHYANAINGRIMQHVPGMTAVLEISGKEIFRSDSTWRYNDKTRYLPSPESWNTIPDVIDARIDNGNWIMPDFDDSSWPFAKPIDGYQWGTMYSRTIPLSMETEIMDLRLLPSGQLLTTALPIELSGDKEILIDLGKMSMVYTVMDLEADEGSRMTMKYALRYENGKPAEMYGRGNIFTARNGFQNFITTDQWGCHYMVIRCDSGRINILGVKMMDRRYPFERVGSFRCNDKIITDLWDMAVNTIEVTCDDGYGSDVRERDEWLQDPAQPNFITTRIALAGPGPGDTKIYSDQRLLKNLLRHASQSQLPDGQILATFPTDRGPEDCHYIIEDYACQWVEALKIYYNSTGDLEFVREMSRSLMAQMNWFLAHLTSRGLLKARSYTSFDNPFAYISCEGADMNAFFYQALMDSRYLLRELGLKQKAGSYSRAATRIKSAYNRFLWNSAERVYNSAFIDDKVYAPTVHAQLIALDRGIVQEKRKESVRKWFLDNYKNDGLKHVCKNPDFETMVRNKTGINMPVVYYWVFQELYRMNSEEMDMEVLREIRRRWTPMVNYLRSIGTLSESFINEKGEGSTESCHNYGAVPAYFISSFILGVRLDGPVWMKKILIEPRLGDLSFAEGTVVTEYGPVWVSWKKLDEDDTLTFKLNIPSGIIATLHLPKISGKNNLIINGKVLMKDGSPGNSIKSKDRWIVVQNASGECSGKLF